MAKINETWSSPRRSGRPVGAPLIKGALGHSKTGTNEINHI
jgi:hypothetical protein